MKNTHLQPDLLFCRQCRRHFRGNRRVCPSDGASLELVTAFLGQAGDVLDQRYVLTEQIGVGGMGTVFRANDSITRRDIALKLLKCEYASNATSAQRFLQEARLVRLVQHPGVVALHRFGRTAEGMLLIDMELVEGESVRDKILHQGHGLDMVTALLVLDNLLASLAACHSAGVIHCDVKPENIMLLKGGSHGQSKLVDFGIAQAPGPIVQNEEIGVVGTPAYMSPEQVRGVKVDCRTDLYLVGCVTYELLTGEPPFAGATPLDLCHHQMLTPPPPLSDRMDTSLLPEGFEAWLMPLLDKDPNRRPPSTRGVRDQLRAVRVGHRRQLADLAKFAQRSSTLRPPSASLLRRPEGVIEPPAPPPREGQFEGVHALLEVRQIAGVGVEYGAEAIEQISRHMLQASLHDLRECGAKVSGPTGCHIEIRMPCDGDERGAVAHLLDAVADMHAQLARIPEPRLEIRAALVADRQGHGAANLDPQQLLLVSPVSQIRVDEHVARWAGRRALVRLTSVPNGLHAAPTDIYATSLHPV